MKKKIFDIWVIAIGIIGLCLEFFSLGLLVGTFNIIFFPLVIMFGILNIICMYFIK